MKSKRKWLAGILSVVMTMTFMPAYAFAGEAAESGNNKDATWKVVIDDGDPELWCYYYDTLQEAMDHEYGSGDAQIILNRDASGKGGIGKDGQDYNINFNGHTYTVTEGVEDEEAGTTAIKLKDGYSCYFTTYSTSKKFKKAKTVTVKSGKTVKKTISKLKSKKTYYVKVCAVKKVKGKSYTGKWSAVKKVKVK